MNDTHRCNQKFYFERLNWYIDPIFMRLTGIQLLVTGWQDWWCPVFPREPDKQWDQNKFSIWKKTKLDGHSSFLNKPNVMLLLSGLLGHSWRFYWFHCVFCSWFLLVWLLNVGANCWYLNDHPLFDSDELPLLFTLLQHQVCHLLSCQLFTETNAPRKAKHVTCIFKSCTRETFIF